MAEKIFGVKRKLGDPLPGREGAWGQSLMGLPSSNPGLTRGHRFTAAMHQTNTSTL